MPINVKAETLVTFSDFKGLALRDRGGRARALGEGGTGFFVVVAYKININYLEDLIFFNLNNIRNLNGQFLVNMYCNPTLKN